MNDLRLLLQVDQNKKVISLQFKQITTLQPMLPLLAKFESLQSLSLHGNRLKTLPSDLSCLQNLVQLDLTNNLFGDVNQIIHSLQTLPNLSHLLYTFRSRQQEEYLRSQLPKLQRINKKPLNNKNLLKSQTARKNADAIKLSEKDLQDVGSIYDQIRDIYKNSKYFLDKQLAQDFDKHVDAIMTDLKQKLAMGGTQISIDNNIICCKYALLDICFVKLINYFYHFDKKIANTLERIHDFQADIFQSSNKLLTIQGQKSKIQLHNVTLKKQQLYLKQIKRLRAYQLEMQQQVQSLENTNKQIIDRMMRIGRSDILQTTLGRFGKSRVISPPSPHSPFSNKKEAKNGKSPAKYPPSQRAIQQIVTINPTQKNLTSHQLKQIICEIMNSKEKHNQLCRQTGHIMQTTEAHMYTYLNQKYGLKNITIDWAMNIVNGIRKYGLDDAEISLFGKILRNQFDQSFFNILRRNKALLRQQIAKFKNKSSSIPNYDQISDDDLISTHQAEQILLNAHVKRDSINAILGQIKDSYLVNNCLTSQSLQKMFMAYLLKNHSQKTSLVRDAFRTADKDQDGIINRQQLQTIGEKAKKGLNLQQLYYVLDPFGTQSITYSHFCQIVFYNPQFKTFFDVGQSK